MSLQMLTIQDFILPKRHGHQKAASDPEPETESQITTAPTRPEGAHEVTHEHDPAAGSDVTSEMVEKIAAEDLDLTEKKAR